MTRIYSERLGAIGADQFATAMARVNLGRFVRAEPTTSGLFGQNVFITTTEGEFVLRGAPHWVKGLEETIYRREDRWQFTKEAFFARELHEQTNAPVVWPYLHEPTSDIFGWPFAVMPRMPGQCFDERSILKALGPDERQDIAVALGTVLSEMHALRWPFAGDVDPNTIALLPYPGGYVSWVRHETVMFARMAGEALTADDKRWIDSVCENAEPHKAPATFVHGDFKLGNLTVTRADDGWRVTGLFDLHEARFGDGVHDLVRQACSYLDTEPQLAAVFIGAWRSRAQPDPDFASRMPAYIVNDRLKLWEYFTRPTHRASWTDDKTFRGWAQRYVDGILALL